MRPISRVLVVPAVVAVIIGGLIAGAIFFLPQTDLIRDRVQAELSRITGRTVILGGLDVRPALPQLCTLTVSKLSIKSQDGAELFAADRATFVPDPTTLLHGVVTVEKVILQDFRTTIIREPDGAMRHVFTRPRSPVEPVSQADSAAQGKPEPLPRGETGPIARPVPPVKDALPQSEAGEHFTLAWAVRTIAFTGGNITWIDRYHARGTDIVIQGRDVFGTVEQTPNQGPIEYDVQGRLAEHGPEPVKASGSIRWNPERTGVGAVSASVTCKELPMAPLLPYIPPQLRVVRPFAVAEVSTDISFDRDNPPTLDFDLALSQAAQSEATLACAGRAQFKPEFSGLDSVSARVTADAVPLRFASYLPGKRFPLDPRAGEASAALEGTWSAQDQWHVQGSVRVAGARGRARLAPLGRPLDIVLTGRLDPGMLALSECHISRERKLIDVSGDVKEPMGAHPSFDLTGSVLVTPGIREILGLELPSGLMIDGSIPCTSTVRGNLAKVDLDVAGSLDSVGVEWKPYLLKPHSGKGALKVQGQYEPGRPGRPGRSFTGSIEVRLGGATVRASARTPQLTDCDVRFQSRLATNERRTGLTGADVTVKRGNTTHGLFNATGNVSFPRQGPFVVQTHARIPVNAAMLGFLGARTPKEWRMNGSAPLALTVAGTQERLECTATLPLMALDVRLGRSLVKPSGTPGKLKAEGAWTRKALTLDNVRVTLPALELTGKGTFPNHRLRTGTVRLTLKRTQVDKIATYLPMLAGLPFSGPITGQVMYHGAGKDAGATARITAAGVRWAPVPDSLTVERLVGTVELRDNTATFTDLSGAVKGLANGPITARGRLTGLDASENLSGRVSLRLSKGRLKGGAVADLVQKGQSLLEFAADPTSQAKQKDLLQYDSITGDITVKSGLARTSNVELQGPRMTGGLIGTYDLVSRRMDLLAALRTTVVSPEVVADIPPVRNFLEKHRSFIEGLGLGDELQKLGIGANKQKKQAAQPEAKPTRTPVVVITRIHGPANEPKVVPVLESALDKKSVGLLKGLIE